VITGKASRIWSPGEHRCGVRDLIRRRSFNLAGAKGEKQKTSRGLGGSNQEKKGGKEFGWGTQRHDDFFKKKKTALTGKGRDFGQPKARYCDWNRKEVGEVLAPKGKTPNLKKFVFCEAVEGETSSRKRPLHYK